MRELTDIARAWEAARGEGGEALLATVVSVSGSTYRRPGARMLLTPTGRLAGSVSGGCLEGDIQQKAWWRTRDGAAVVSYDSTDEDEDVVWGFGLGCNGVVRVLLERVSPPSPGPLDFLAACLHGRRPGVIATVFASDGPVAHMGQRLLLDASGIIDSSITDAALSVRLEEDARAVLRAGQSRAQTYGLPNGTADVFLEAVQPPLPLVVFGAGHDALPLVRLAKEMGWHVTVVDTRAARARPERFPDADSMIACPADAVTAHVPLSAHTMAVVMTHNYPDDKRVLRALLASPAAYIGQLGPAKRTERLLAEIADDGFTITDAHRARLHGPVGLDLGADSPEGIALSVVAEIQAARAGRGGGPLRDRRAPLHPRPELTATPRGADTEKATCQLSAS